MISMLKNLTIVNSYKREQIFVLKYYGISENLVFNQNKTDKYLKNFTCHKLFLYFLFLTLPFKRELNI